MDWVREEGDRRSDECLTEWEKRASERGWLVKRMISEVVNVWRSRRKGWVSEDDRRRGWVIGEGSNVMTEWEKRVSERCAEAWEGEGDGLCGRDSEWESDSLISKITYLKPSLRDSVSRVETESQRLGFHVFNQRSTWKPHVFNQRSTWKPRKNRVLNTRFLRGLHLDLLPRQG